MVNLHEIMSKRADADKKTGLIDLSVEELLEKVHAFMGGPLPPECVRFSDTFDQDGFDKWAGHAFEIKDHITALINGRQLPVDDTLSLAERWDGYLGYGATGAPATASIPYDVFTGGMQSLSEPHKLGYHIYLYGFLQQICPAGGAECRILA